MDNTQPPIFSSPSADDTQLSVGRGAQPYLASSHSNLNPAQPNQKKKKIVLIICITLLVLFFGVVGFLLLRNNNSRAIFNQYANFLLYGKESSGDITEDYVWGYRYYARSLDTAYSDDYAKYLDKLKTKYEELLNRYPDKLSDYDDDFWLFYYTARYPEIELSDVVAAMESGNNSEEEILKTINENYAPFLASSNSLVKEYGYTKIKMLSGNGDYDLEEFPDFKIEIFQRIWNLKEEFYEK